jgi:hypothetical protein
VTYFLKTINKPTDREELLRRFEALDPTEPARWGRLTAPRMLAHLCDQMRLPLSDHSLRPIPAPSRYPVMRELFLYLLPWPKSKIKGPPEAFETDPEAWSADLARLRELVDQFLQLDPESKWPDHPHFGRMNQSSWGYFCYRHFNHHLRQFGG